MKIRVDENRCSGHGRCYSLAPDVFEPDEQGHSRVVVEEIPSALEAQADIGVANCPEQAISIVP